MYERMSEKKGFASVVSTHVPVPVSDDFFVNTYMPYAVICK